MELTFRMGEGLWNVLKFFIVEVLVSVCVAESYSFFMSALADYYVRRGKPVQVSTAWFVRLSPINTFVLDRSRSNRRDRWPMASGIAVLSFIILALVITLEFGSSSNERPSDRVVQWQAHTGSLAMSDEVVDSQEREFESGNGVSNQYRDSDMNVIVDAAYQSGCFSFELHDGEEVPTASSMDPVEATLLVWPFTPDGVCLRNITKSTRAVQIGFNTDLSDSGTMMVNGERVTADMKVNAMVGLVTEFDGELKGVTVYCDNCFTYNPSKYVTMSDFSLASSHVWGPEVVQKGMGGFSDLRCLVPDYREGYWYCQFDLEDEDKVVLFAAWVRI